MIRWLVLLFCCSFIANADDYTDGVDLGVTAIENAKAIDLQQMMSSDLADSLNKGDETTSFGMFAGKNANSVIGERQGAGKSVTNALSDEASSIVSQGQVLDTESQAGFSRKRTEDLSHQDLANHTLVDAELMDNPINPATQYAHDLQTGNAHFEMAEEELTGKTYQQEYDEIVVSKTKEIETEKTCSQSLVGDTHDRVMKLEVGVDSRPAQNKTVNLTFYGHWSSISVNLISGGLVSSNANSQYGPCYFNIDSPLSDWAREPGFNLEYLGHSISKRIGAYYNIGGAGNPYMYPSATFPSLRNGFIFSTSTRELNAYQYEHLGDSIYKFHWRASIPVKTVYKNETWVSDTSAGAGWIESGLFDDLVAEDICQVAHEECLEGPATRNINGLSVNRPCWKKRVTYKCKIPQGEEDCGGIPSNCIETETQHIEFVGKPAVAVKKFRCLETVTERERKRVPKTAGLKKIEDYQKNNDISDAIVALNFAKEMMDSFRSKLGSIAGRFFQGQYYRCNKTKGCCVDKNSGWSKVFHCNGEEKELADKVRAKGCYKIGEFRSTKGVARKVIKITKSGYCCYQSPIARILQEGAHRQLGKSWGDPEEAACEALTIEELQNLDFDKADFDFSDLFTELKEKALATGVSGSRVEALKAQITQGLTADTTTKLGAGVENLTGQKIQAEMNKKEQEKLQTTIEDRKLSTFR